MLLTPVRSHAKELPQSSAPAWTPSPYALLRLAGKPYVEMERLKFSQTVRLFDEILVAQAWLEAQKSYLCDEALYAEIGRTTGKIRAQLVAFKRDLFNARPLSLTQRRLLRAHTPPTVRRAVIHYLWRWRAYRRLLQTARHTFQREYDDRRELLRASLRDPNFQKAMQIASPTLYSQLTHYIAADKEALNNRALHKVEAGALRYFIRMTSKTSPFSRFGPVALASVDPAAPRALTWQAPTMRMHSQVTFNLAVTATLARSLSLAPGIRPFLKPYLNGTYFVEGDTITFVRPMIVDNQEVYTSSNLLRRGPYTPSMRAVVMFLEAHQHANLDWLAVVEGVLTQGAPGLTTRSAVEAFLQKLVDAGLVLHQFRLPSNTLDRLADLQTQVAAIPTPQAQALAAQLAELVALGPQLARGSADERAAILECSQQLVQELTVWWQRAGQARRADYWIEDAFIPEMRLRLGPDFFEPFIDDASALIECLYARDQGGLNRMMLKDVLVNAYGVGGVCDNLLKFSTEYMRVVLQADFNDHVGYPRSAFVNRQALRYVQTLTALEDHRQREVTIEPQLFHALTAEFGGPVVEPISVALNVQVAATDWAAVERGDFLAVLNYALPGFGHFYTRYCYLFEDRSGATPLAEQIRARVAQLQADQPERRELVELLSVLDHNAQVHPCFTARQITPPTENSQLPPTQHISVRELRLEHDPVSDEVRVYVVEADQAQTITPIYMGFFHTMALPSLHRILVDLSPTGYHMERLKPSEHRESLLSYLTDDPGHGQPVRHYPRMRIGRFVLQRELWAFSSTHTPRENSADHFDTFFQTYTWAKQHGLPVETFVRIKRDRFQADIDFQIDHKPMLLDFENFFTVQTFHHLISKDHISAVHVEEMLPGPRDLFFEHDGQRYAVEFQIELNREALRHE